MFIAPKLVRALEENHIAHSCRLWEALRFLTSLVQYRYRSAAATELDLFPTHFTNIEQRRFGLHPSRRNSPGTPGLFIFASPLYAVDHRHEVS